MKQEDKFRKFHIITEDGKVLTDIYLYESGVSDTPTFAKNGANKELAKTLHGWLDAEARGHVAFGKFA